MRKEVLFALLAGATLGLVITFGALRANSKINSPNIEEEIFQHTAGEEVIIQDFNNIPFEVQSPTDSDVVTTSQVIVYGTANPNNWLVVSTEEEDIITNPETDGSFEQDIKLNSGINNISVTSISEEKSESIHFSVVYSTEFSKTIGFENDTEGNQL